MAYVFNPFTGTLDNTGAGGGGGVDDVSNIDGTLTISPTTGSVVASLNLNNANSWVGKQTFTTTAPRFSTLTTNGGIFYGNASGDLQQTGAGTATQVLHGGTSPTYGAVVLTTDVSGILPVANGGTGTSTAFTTGSVIFQGASGYAEDNANLFWDDSNNRLGVGTNSVVSSKITIATTSTTETALYFKEPVSYSTFGLWIRDSNNYSKLRTGTTGTFSGDTGVDYKLTALGDCDGNAVGPIVAQGTGLNGIGTALTLDASALGGGKKLSFLSTGNNALLAGGYFAIFNGSDSYYPFAMRYDGHFYFMRNAATDMSAMLNIIPNASTEKGISIRGAVGQTANLIEFQSSAGAVLTSVDDDGKFNALAGLTDGVDVVVGSTTGTKIGTATTQKLAFFNSTPIVQPANSVSLETVLSNLGLRASGTSAPLAIGNLTMTDATNIILDTTTGTKIGTATTQKLAFFNSTPIVQPANSVSLETVLSNLGLRASGTTAPLSIGNLTIADGSNVILDTTTGTKFGTATTQKIGFLNATPIVQQANSVSLEAVLSNFGFRASGTAAPISVGVMTATTSANVIAGTSSRAAKIGGAIIDYYTNAGNTGTSETDLYTTTLEANILGANGDKLVIRYGIDLPSASGATVNIRMYFGGSAIFGTGALTKLAAGWMDIHVEIIRVSNTTIRYTAFFQNTGYGSVPLVGGAELGGLTLSNTNVIKITGQAGAGGANNDIVAKLGSIKWYPAA